ncbi:hypothetical protein [Methylobacterium sp. SI9]|uniref:hypothetical protein n=1 Tax=Methylobacterium guangdongense TaxID=3138811 RepID=UPI00313DE1B0
MSQQNLHENYAICRRNVEIAVDILRYVPENKRQDLNFLEYELIPVLGLNNEILHEQPRELSGYFGTGLYLWQYPNQFARALAWLSCEAPAIDSYLEIGCRWGGTFIVMTEWLRLNGANLRSVSAVDPIEISPFITAYFELLNGSGIERFYLKMISTDRQVAEFVTKIRPQCVFVDGDHSIRVAMLDHMMVRDHAKIIIHHDVASLACPETVELWGALKVLEAPNFEAFEFLDQYESVDGNYLGIGILRRRAGI